MISYRENPEGNYKLSTVDFGFKNCIKSVAVSYNFVLFLNSHGLLYSSGDNEKGQLGLGVVSRKSVGQPQLIKSLSDMREIIETVSVGIGHVVAKSKLGYVYTWGDNCFGQVNNQPVNLVSAPQILETEDGKLKVLQAVAGARAFFVLTDSLKIVGFGTSSSFNSQKSVFNYSLDLLRVVLVLCSRRLVAKI